MRPTKQTKAFLPATHDDMNPSTQQTLQQIFLLTCYKVDSNEVSTLAAHENHTGTGFSSRISLPVIPSFKVLKYSSQSFSEGGLLGSTVKGSLNGTVLLTCQKNAVLCKRTYSTSKHCPITKCSRPSWSKKNSTLHEYVKRRCKIKTSNVLSHAYGLSSAATQMRATSSLDILPWNCNKRKQIEVQSIARFMTYSQQKQPYAS